MKRFFSLRVKIALTIFVLELVMMVAVITQSMALVRTQVEQQSQAGNDALLDTFEHLAVTALMTEEYSELQASVEKVTKDISIERVVITDPNNLILINSTPGNLGTYFETTSTDDRYVWKTRKIGNAGYIHALLSRVELEKSIAAASREGWRIAIIGMSVIGFSSLTIGYLLTSRLARLENAAQAISSGNYNARTELRGDDEVAHLSQAFDAMARAIQDNINRYKRQQAELEQAQESLKRHSEMLEEVVHERTKNLEIANHALQKLATFDFLTKIPNRLGVEYYLTQIYESIKGKPAIFSLLLCDIDFFKNYNDTYGHLAGDHCLRAIAEILQKCVRKDTDLVGRYGGEEFVVLLPHGPLDRAISVANDIIMNVRLQNIEHTGSDIARHVTISVGVAFSDSLNEETFEKIIQRADAALYQAKHAGRNQYAVADNNDGGSLPAQSGQESNQV